MDREILQKFIQEDELGLLTVKPKVSAEASAAERLRISFLEIIEFVRKNGREPAPNRADIKEMALYSRLSGLRQDLKKIEALHEYDELGLLSAVKPIESIKDVFDDDDLGLLNDDAESIFTLKNVPMPKSITNLPDYIAQRKPCPDFADFEHLFKQCQSDLSSRKRILMPFARGSHINKGDFFVLKGVLVYVANEGKREPTADRNTFNARLRCIFENGTESDLLLRSLAAALYKEDGLRVSTPTDKLPNTINDITADDQQTGFVYVLRSLSNKQEIKTLKHLYKIGFSSGPVEERIRNAAHEPTYLMAPVAIVTAYQCYNLNAQKLEHLLHVFFGPACLQLEVIDKEGQRCIPKEWFIAPLEIIKATIPLLISGEIVNYQYNPDRQEIEAR